MKIITALVLLVTSNLANASLCDDQLDHVWNMYELAGRAISPFQKMPSEVNIVSIENYSSDLIQVHGNMKCPAYVNAKATIKLKFADLPGCVVETNIERTGSMAVSDIQPIFSYSYGEVLYKCSQ